jgi:ketosteroid isomerase-like protein
MRFSIRLISAFLRPVLLLAGCAGARKSRSPEPMMVDHPMHTPLLVSGMMMDREVRAMQDSAIMRVVRARMDDWNQGNLEGFLAMYDEQAAYVHENGYSDARQAVRRIHTERWFRDGGGPSARLSARLVRTQRVGDARRRAILVWTATDSATGRGETWSSELTFQFFRGSDWRIVHEAPPPPEG